MIVADVHLIRRLHKLFERLHGLVHLGVVEVANAEVVILKRLRAHIGHLCHARRRVTQNDPLCFLHADKRVHRMPVEAVVTFGILGRHVAHLRAVVAAANANVGLHLLHELCVDLGHELELLVRGAL
ncbi:hypothetical protein SDC9_123543 [bioreactor metagenome]|uniref:Uncharacterized protein n=1 Tax=bioreactor metagenome TaxID=1076179 RepID=A0A645CHX8_9ZZZZ